MHFTGEIWQENTNLPKCPDHLNATVIKRLAAQSAEKILVRSIHNPGENGIATVGMRGGPNSNTFQKSFSLKVLYPL